MRIKKFLSIVCSLSIAMSTFVGFNVAKASETKPTVYTKLEKKDFNADLEGVPQYVLTISVENLTGFSISKTTGLSVKWTGNAIKNLAVTLGYDANKVFVYGTDGAGTPNVLLPTTMKSCTQNPNKDVDGQNAYYLTWQTATASEYIFEGNGVCTDATSFDIAELYIVPIDGYDDGEPIIAESFDSNPMSFIDTQSIIYNNYNNVASSKGTQKELTTYDSTLVAEDGVYPEVKTPTATAGNAYKERSTFYGDTVEIPDGATQIDATIEKTNATAKTDKIDCPSGVVGGKAKILPIVSYKLGENGVTAGDIFTLILKNGTTELGKWTYTVPAE